MAGTRKATPQQFIFAEHYARYGDLMAAFQAAYPRQCNNQPKSRIRKRASEVLRHQAVQNEIERVQDSMRAVERLTPEQHISQLASLRDEAREKGQYMAAIKAEQLRGHASGFYIEKHLHKHEHQLSSDEIIQRIHALVSQNPHLAHMLSPDQQAAVLEAPSEGGTTSKSESSAHEDDSETPQQARRILPEPQRSGS